MSQRIEDYALIGDTHTAALVGRDGSLDWLCVPRFDSSACFAALVGQPEHGRWLIGARAGGPAARRSYRAGTLVLVQEWDTPGGRVRVTDFMPPRHHRPRVFRRVEGLAGIVDMSTELIIRFEYGYQVPWVVQKDKGIRAVAGPDAIEVDAPVALVGEHMRHHADFAVSEGEVLDFRLRWAPSYEDGGNELDCGRALADTLSFWGDWSGGLTPVHGEWEDQVQRSLLTLKALTYAAHRGHSGRPHHLVARGDRGRPQLGLPVLLGEGRHADHRRLGRGWVRR